MGLRDEDDSDTNDEQTVASSGESTGKNKKVVEPQSVDKKGGIVNRQWLPWEQFSPRLVWMTMM